MRAAISRSFTTWVTMPADLYFRCAYLPPAAVWNAGPYFVVHQVARGCDPNGVGFAVPLRIREHIRAILTFHDARIFDAAGPLAGLLVVFGRRKHRLADAREVDSIRALRQPQPRGMSANLHRARAVLGAIQHIHFAFAHNRCGIEGVQRLPGHRRLRNRVIKCRLRPRSDDRVSFCRAREGSNHPCRRVLRIRHGRAQKRGRKTPSKSHCLVSDSHRCPHIPSAACDQRDSSYSPGVDSPVVPSLTL